MANEYPDRPRVAVGVLVLHEGRLLVVERANPPGQGVWALPGGSVELGETMAAAAERETREETGLVVRALDVVYAFDAVVKDAAGRVQYHYAIVDFVCEYVSGSVHAGGDARDARLVTRQEFAALRSSRFTVDLLRARTNFLDDTTAPPALRRPLC